MVSLPFLIALLTFIDVTRSFEYFIDLKRCEANARHETELKCYIRASCLDSSTAPADKNMLVQFTNAKLKGGNCDVIMQMKAFTDYKFHIMMQVDVAASDSPSDELDTTAGVSIVQDTQQIKCSSSGLEEGGVVAVEEYGTRQVYKKNLIFCSAWLKSANGQIKDLYNVNPLKSLPPRIEFTTKDTQNQKIIFGENGNGMWFPTARCDDATLFTKNTTLGDLLAFEVDKAPSDLSCPNHPQIAIPLRLRVVNGEERLWPQRVYCKGTSWAYMDGEVVHAVSADFNVYCAIEFDKLCTPLQTNKCPGGDCIPPQITPTTVSCPENRWRLVDGSVIESTVICKQRKSERSSGWFMEDGKEITEGGCSSVFHCPTFSKLVLSLPSTEPEYREVDRSAGDKDFSCPAGFDLTVSLNGKTRSATKISCYPATGLYKIDGGTDTVARGSTVYCKKIFGEISSATSDWVSYWAMGFVALKAIISL